jgi:hypothetical protein
MLRALMRGAHDRESNGGHEDELAEADGEARQCRGGDRGQHNGGETPPT